MVKERSNSTSQWEREHFSQCHPSPSRISWLKLCLQFRVTACVQGHRINSRVLACAARTCFRSNSRTWQRLNQMSSTTKALWTKSLSFHAIQQMSKSCNCTTAATPLRGLVSLIIYSEDKLGNVCNIWKGHNTLSRPRWAITSSRQSRCEIQRTFWHQIVYSPCFRSVKNDRDKYRAT